MDTIRTRHHKRLIEELIAARKRAGITQIDLARRLRRTQTWVARMEGGGRRVDVVEFLMLARALHCDPVEMIARIAKSNG